MGVVSRKALGTRYVQASRIPNLRVGVRQKDVDARQGEEADAGGGAQKAEGYRGGDCRSCLCCRVGVAEGRRGLSVVREGDSDN